MQVKSKETDGYNAVQLGHEDVKESRRRKPDQGHAAKANTVAKKFVRSGVWLTTSWPSCSCDDLGFGFADVKYVDISGTSKGKGTPAL